MTSCDTASATPFFCSSGAIGKPKSAPRSPRAPIVSCTAQSCSRPRSISVAAPSRCVRLIHVCARCTNAALSYPPRSAGASLRLLVEFSGSTGCAWRWEERRGRPPPLRSRFSLSIRVADTHELRGPCVCAELGVGSSILL